MLFIHHNLVRASGGRVVSTRNVLFVAKLVEIQPLETSGKKTMAFSHYKDWSGVQS